MISNAEDFFSWVGSNGKTLNEMEGGRRVVGIVLLGPWDPQSPSCMSDVQSVSSLFGTSPSSQDYVRMVSLVTSSGK